MAEHDIFGDVSDSDDDDDDIQAAASDGDIMKAGALMYLLEIHEYRNNENKFRTDVLPLFLPLANNPEF